MTKTITLKVRRLNARTGILPKETRIQTLLMLKLEPETGRILQHWIYVNFNTEYDWAPVGFTHYAVLPSHI